MKRARAPLARAPCAATAQARQIHPAIARAAARSPGIRIDGQDCPSNWGTYSSRILRSQAKGLTQSGWSQQGRPPPSLLSRLRRRSRVPSGPGGARWLSGRCLESRISSHAAPGHERRTGRDQIARAERRRRVFEVPSAPRRCQGLRKSPRRRSSRRAPPGTDRPERRARFSRRAGAVSASGEPGPCLALQGAPEPRGCAGAPSPARRRREPGVKKGSRPPLDGEERAALGSFGARSCAGWERLRDPAPGSRNCFSRSPGSGAWNPGNPLGSGSAGLGQVDRLGVSSCP
jgi:hypothetical protein